MVESFGERRFLGTQISILWGYPYLIGLYCKGVYMGYPYAEFLLITPAYVRFWGPSFCGFFQGISGARLQN